MEYLYQAVAPGFVKSTDAGSGALLAMEATAVLLPPATHTRSDEASASTMARTLEAQRLSLTEEQFRGLEVGDLLHGGARLFANGGEAARVDPAGTYALSRPVERLDYFVSHAWRSSRIAKWLSLLCYFNLNAACVAYLITGLACFTFSVFFFEALPPKFIKPVEGLMFDNTEVRAVYVAEIFCYLACIIVFFFGHLIFRRGEKAFLDIACIDQLDAENKAAGINSLGALLDRSERMVVLLDEHNLSRMWCVFEIAAFAKRSSMNRMDLVPLHLGLQKTAIVFLMVFGLLYGLLPIPTGLCGSDCETPRGGNALGLFILNIGGTLPPMLLLVHATWYGQVAKRSLARLRHFTLSDVGCHSDVDRAAITELIGRWFADETAIDGADGKMARDVGIYNFEMFVRMEVRTKIEEALGGNGSFKWSPTLSLLVFLWSVVSWFFDVASPPEVGMYYIIGLISFAISMVLFGAPLLGLGINLAAVAVGRMREKCGHTIALLLSLPLLFLSFIAFMIGGSLLCPFLFASGGNSSIGQMRFPDDGLDPDSSRRVIKFQVISLVVLLFVVVWGGRVRDMGSR